jgi:hypothetical protein
MREEPQSSLDRIAIPEPCPMAAELARGGKPDRRDCDKREKHVVNPSVLKKQQAEDEVRAAQEAGKRLCARIYRDQEIGKILTRDDLPRLAARLARHRLLLISNQESAKQFGSKATAIKTRLPPKTSTHSYRFSATSKSDSRVALSRNPRDKLWHAQAVNQTPDQRAARHPGTRTHFFSAHQSQIHR